VKKMRVIGNSVYDIIELQRKCNVTSNKKSEKQK
jgi:hypothetical protein